MRVTDRGTVPCEFNHSPSAGNHTALYVIKTNRIANPGRTPVTMHACGTHVSVAIWEQFRNAARLAEQDMPGKDGITIEQVNT